MAISPGSVLAVACAELGRGSKIGGRVLASSLLRAAPVAAAALLLSLPGSAFANSAPTRKAVNAAPWVNDGLSGSATARLAGRGSSFTRQHGGENHLPPVRVNVDLVGKLKVDTPAAFRTPEHNKPVEEGQIADLAIYKQAAYLNSWAEPAEADDTCHRGGFFSADISNPSNPKQLAFVPALPETYHGEGAHVVTFNGRDILAVNNEPCGPNGVGGFDLYDVTNPAAPVTLVKGAGDQSSDNPQTGAGDTDPGPHPGAQQRALDLPVAGRRQALRRHRRQHRAPRRRHLRRHHTGDAEVHRRLRPRGTGRRAELRPDRQLRARQRDLPPRRGGQADRRRADDAGLLLGRGLRQAQRQRPDRADVHRRLRLRHHRPAHGLPAAGGQRPRGRVQPRQPVRARRGRGLLAVPRPDGGPVRIDLRSDLRVGRADRRRQPHLGPA